ncbi:hypothetical protein GPJ56_003364 [Histomonas meleagridis]|uniref:uncharacterized protein n=1 Tax=Histomonas meleagridis TaxID=135588 RepID=UPI0035595C8E|nr:hypothetical protein GPJ56_003364 [Histomonas meleagridis]KAH0804983.1 hypothetical protein GO595_001928 [Histomonas meleagridis]
MLSKDQLDFYFEHLVDDFWITIKGKKYGVNRSLASSLSKYISEIDPSSSEITLDIDDPHDCFPLVIDFLHGKKIEITTLNDYSIQQIAEFLQIESLLNLTRQSLEEPLTPKNVRDRLYQNPNNETYLNYLYENIESIRNENSLTQFEPDILLKVKNFTKSNFTSVKSRYTFYFDCCISFPTLVTQFLTNDDIRQIPEEVLSLLVSDEKYSTLDDIIPFYPIAQNLYHQVEDNKHQYQNLLVQCEESMKEKEDIISKRDKYKELAEMKEKNEKLYNDIKEFSNDFQENSRINVLNDYKVSQNTLDEIQNNIKEIEEQISMKKSNCKQENLRNSCAEAEDTLEDLAMCLNKLLPNDTDIEMILEETEKIAKNLGNLAQEAFNVLEPNS